MKAHLIMSRTYEEATLEAPTAGSAAKRFVGAHFSEHFFRENADKI